MTVERVGGVFVASITGILCLLFASMTLIRCLLRRRGVSTTAELVRFRTKVAEDGELLYFPVVTFTLPNGEKVRAEGEGMSHPPRGTGEGDHTEVVYDPVAPTSMTLPSLQPGRLKTGEILAHGSASLAFAFLTYQILADTF
ncbi:hypothetical protein GCM10010372_45500 [Streptomyces tauricus]|uniref:DUF3592 domain-containing protein n=1 Tax=Streptomyces tauricus TaxID=68274 RepID=A0ABZ1JET9_9ACTN|nr:DUF3592 domain-containing protein [Streptomyces tauricus]MCW8095194.1 DUF3592 domain-containing protein [Streptomyces tauricus]GHA40246.1 hypothetical protein GCM10010372_45500 [Streptomyces tauricus]